MSRKISARSVFLNLLGSAILAFGLYNIHSRSGVTEGGILGLTLLLQHWFQISPALSGLVLNALCFFFGFLMLGGRFVLMSAIAGGGFSLFYALFEQFPPVFSAVAADPLAASLVGALFVGVGVGLSVKEGGASGGDDALAMGLNKLMGWDIRTVYLISDLTVLLLSLSYIPFQQIFYSLLTVVLSGQIIGLIANDKKQ